MNIKIKRLDTTLPLPEYHTSGAVAFDLYARVDTEIPAQSIARIPTNLIIEVPAGYMLYLKDRSSTAKKKGLMAVGGVIDQDFCGESDEILFQVYNFTHETVIVERGERIGQGIFVKIDKAEWTEVPKMINKSRGGFGSTGDNV